VVRPHLKKGLTPTSGIFMVITCISERHVWGSDPATRPGCRPRRDGGSDPIPSDPIPSERHGREGPCELGGGQWGQTPLEEGCDPNFRYIYGYYMYFRAPCVGSDPATRPGCSTPQGRGSDPIRSDPFHQNATAAAAHANLAAAKWGLTPHSHTKKGLT